MDDRVTSAETVEKAVQLAHEIFATGDLRPDKLESNNRAILHM